MSYRYFIYFLAVCIGLNISDTVASPQKNTQLENIAQFNIPKDFTAQNLKSSYIHELIQKIQNGTEISSELLMNALAEKENPQEKVDLFLSSLLTIPFEKRQYIFPAVFESPFIPQKIRTHPEIAIWEGTVPTKIAPQMQDFAAKYLSDLNPILYIFLSPEAFQKPHQDLNKSQYSLRMRSATSEKTHIKNNPYHSIQFYYKPSKVLQKNPHQSYLADLTPEKLDNGFGILSSFILSQKNTKKLISDLDLLKIFYTEDAENHINPIQSFIQRIRFMKKGKELDQVFAQNGWKNATEFAQKADLVLKAYRSNFINLNMAFNFHKIKGKKEPMSIQERQLLTTALMHEALPEDVKWAEKNLEQIQKIFKKEGYSSLLNSVMIDTFPEIGYNAAK